MKEKSRQKRLRLLAEAKKKPAVFTVYIVLRLIVVAILVSSILRGEYENAAICRSWPNGWAIIIATASSAKICVRPAAISD